MVESSMERTTLKFPYKECAVIALVSVSIFLGLGLLSYAPVDHHLHESILGSDHSNLVGQVGLVVSRSTGFTLGWIAFSIPILTFGLALRIGLSTPFNVNWLRFGVGLIAFVWVLATCCVVAQLHILEGFANFTAPGGWLGFVITEHTLPYLGATGLTLVACTVAIIGIQLFLGFSWVTVSTVLIRTSSKLARLGWRGLLVLHASTQKFLIAVWQLLRRFVLNVATLKEYASRDGRVQKKRTIPIVETTQQLIQLNDERTTETSTTSSNLPARQLPRYESGDETRTSNATAVDRQIEIATSYSLPSYELLAEVQSNKEDEVARNSELKELGEKLQANFADFGVDASVVTIVPGPVVTRFELELAAGVKVAKITNLVKDIARALAVPSVRVVPVIPGKTVVGVEVPNSKRKIVLLKEVLQGHQLDKLEDPLMFVLGSNIAGEPVFADIEKMPHLLIAGTTGSGKSVAINVILLSLLFRVSPENVRLVLIDPKMLELSVYEGIPHLLTPVVTNMDDAATVLNWCVAEMERRYRLLSHLNVRNLNGFNAKVARAEAEGNLLYGPPLDELGNTEPEPLTHLPRILVVVDEFADLILIVGKKVEQLIVRIAQKARAAGIHLVLATQRPSVDVITGLIKANIPSRISFQVSSQIDSRTILDQVGAEQLLGQGDMLYLASGTSVPERIHGAFVSDDEVLAVVRDLAAKADVAYDETVFSEIPNGTSNLPSESQGPDTDPLYQEAVQFVLDSNKASISSVQRKFRVGYNRAANLIERMELDGVVSQPSNNGSREILVSQSS